jgi:HEAT repeat protein
MWRRFGDVTFALIVLSIITVEALPLALLMWRMASQVSGRRSSPGTEGQLLITVSVAALGLLLVTIYVLGYHSASARHETAGAARREAWTKRWIDVLFGQESRPPSPLPKEGVDALLDLREVLKGEEGNRLERLAEQYELGRMLIRKLASHRVSVRLDALEALARFRLPDAFTAITERLTDPVATVRLAAARAGARTLAVISDPHRRDAAAASLSEALKRSGLPVGAVEEALLLSQESAPAIILHVLAQDDPSPGAVRAALDTIGRLGLLTFADEAGRFSRDADPEIRAACFRSLGRLGYLPDHVETALTAALEDEVEFVRVEATRAGRFLDKAQALTALEIRLGDSSWWVRLAAAECLLSMGSPGIDTLRDVATHHPDSFARDMAVQAMLDAHLLDADEARSLKDAV